MTSSPDVLDTIIARFQAAYRRHLEDDVSVVDYPRLRLRVYNELKEAFSSEEVWRHTDLIAAWIDRAEREVELERARREGRVPDVREVAEAALDVAERFGWHADISWNADASQITIKPDPERRQQVLQALPYYRDAFAEQVGGAVASLIALQVAGAERDAQEAPGREADPPSLARR